MITITISQSNFEELAKLVVVPHEHYDGMNECYICDRPITEAAIEKIKELEAKWAKAVADMNAIDGCWEKKYESLEAQCAEMRKIIPELWRCANDDCDLSQAQIDHVLSYDCGNETP